MDYSPDMKSVARILVGLVLLSSGTAHSKLKLSRRPVPAPAAELISKTAAWSAARDFASLRRVMTDDFVWSFGAEDGPDGAIAEWRNDQDYLAALVQVLKLPCLTSSNGKVVECPGKEGSLFRAWFVRTRAGWRFTGFVEGD